MGFPELPTLHTFSVRQGYERKHSILYRDSNLQSGIILSYVRERKRHAAFGAAWGMFPCIRHQGSNCLVAHGHRRIPMAGLCYDSAPDGEFLVSENTSGKTA